ncbi:MAG: Hpt domain-containing protein [Burkholderiales bacterium]|nr:Hpt domain-containing protein [Burkholderiales bacterium]
MPHADAILVEVDAELAALVPGFLARRREDAAAIRAAARAGDFATARSLGHQLKGSGGGYGFPEITRLGAEIEEAAKSHDAGRVVEWAETLSDYLRRLQVRYV